MYTSTTENIEVSVQPVYLDGQSNWMEKKFTFAYFIKITNSSNSPVKLLRRHWYITDGDAAVKEVEGIGVVGKQPIIKPGKSHKYNSFCVLENMEGSMSGTYLMKRGSEEVFKISIPKFALRANAN
ncbi:MAG: Co2+/Mg2+ efflux protein ApaG [Bacteroidetes bacterium]|nr:Co2+/Mg2+ efflux protein ApaG [Bacteroidota bacterium]